MKVSILTFHYANNYGAVLQCYALSKAIQELGHEVEILDFLPQSKKMTIKQKISSFVLSTRFNSFRKNYLPKFSKAYSSSQELNVYPKADCYVVGSDQVWNPQISKGNLLVYFFDFLKNNEKRFSYAASFGIEKWNDSEEVKPIKTLLDKFSAISIREGVGVKLCKDTFGHDSVQVLDPTLLLPNYDNLIKGFDPNKKSGVVVYKFKRGKELYKLSTHVAAAFNEKVTCVNDHRLSKNGAGTSYFTPVIKWINLIKTSSLVITDSYHCMVFAIIYKRPFIAMPAHPDRLSRMFSLLQDLGLEDRFFKSYEDIYKSDTWKASIDYEKAHRILLEKRELSLGFLRDTLTQINSSL